MACLEIYIYIVMRKRKRMWNSGRVEEASKFHVLSFDNIFIFHMYKDLMNITKMYKMEIYIEREREKL